MSTTTYISRFTLFEAAGDAGCTKLELHLLEDATYRFEYNTGQVLSHCATLARELERTVAAVRGGKGLNDRGVVHSTGPDLDRAVTAREAAATDLRRMAGLLRDEHPVLAEQITTWMNQEPAR